MRIVGWRDAGALRNAHEIGDGSDPELLHDTAAMNLDRLFGGVEFRGNLFVQKTHDDEAQDLKLTRRQFLDATTCFPSFPAFVQLFLGTFESKFDRFDQFYIVKGLRQKINGAAFHRLSGSRHVAVAGNENNLLASTSFFERLLEPQTIQSRHADIENQATRAFEDLSCALVL